MADIGFRGALSGVNELVTFLEAASTNDRSAFSKKANVIFECRTCATLFRKADGFMRHVMRCDTSRSGDVDSEPDRRTLLISPTSEVTEAKTTRMVPLKKPSENEMAPASDTHLKATAASKPSYTLQQKDINVKKIFVKTEPSSSPPRFEAESESDMRASSSPRAQKRPNNRITSQKVIPEKIRRSDVGNGREVAASISSKSKKSSEVKLQDLNADIRPSRMRKTPKWLNDAFVV